MSCFNYFFFRAPALIFQILRGVRSAHTYILLPVAICMMVFQGAFASTGESADADTIELQAISTADRSDGLGYVVRFHFSAQPDSFRVIQPDADHSQIIFYHDSIEYSEVRMPSSRVFSAFNISGIPNGIGIDIHFLPPEERRQARVYMARAYPDQNGRHILLSYTEISEREMEILSDGLAPVNWDRLRANSGGEQQIITEATGEQAEEAVSGLSETPGDTSSASSQSPFTEINRSAISFDTVILDAGHGGRDPGAVSPNGHYEKDIVLEVTKKLGAYIEEYLPELKVVYTRKDDTFLGLAERGRIANRSEGHLFISIHTNSYSGRRASGAEFYFLGTGRSQSALEVMQRENSVIRFEEGDDATTELTRDQLMVYELQNIGNMNMSQHFAELLNHQFSERAQRRSRGVKQAGLQVLFEASMPGVLVELGFISNPEEERFMTSDYGQSILASAIFRAVREYKESVERVFNRQQAEE